MTGRYAAAAALLLAGCPSAPAEPPPPPLKPEIAAAPPRALGALAAGTEAAPGVQAADVPRQPRAAPGAGGGVPQAGEPEPGLPVAPVAPDAGLSL